MRKRPPKHTKPKLRTAVRARPTFISISGEVKVWSARLIEELQTWPGITTKPMFGFLSFYRKKVIFAALSTTKGFGSPSSFMLKFDSLPSSLLTRAQNDTRLNISTRVPGQGWFSFELNSESDIRDALFWLGKAYEALGK